MLLCPILMELAAGLMAIPFDGAPGAASPGTLGEGHLRLSTGWSRSEVRLEALRAEDSSRNGTDSRIESVELAMGWGVSTWTDLGVSSAYHFESGLPLREPQASGFGDTWIHLRQGVPLDALTGPVKMALRARLGLPTGERGQGVWAREGFSQPTGSTADREGSTAFGGAGFSWGGSVGAGLDLSRWSVPLEVFGEGGIDASSASGRDPQLGSAIGFQASPTPFPLQVFGSFQWTAPLHLGDSTASPRSRVAAGAMVRVRPWFSLQGEFWGSIGSHRMRQQEVRIGPDAAPVSVRVPGDAPSGFALRLALDLVGPDPDADRDGVQDRFDRCPAEPEDKDGFEDADGCPDPDNDRDGVCDSWVAAQGGAAPSRWGSLCRGIDVCPQAKEDIDGFEDRDGCPDPDNDGDRICDPWVETTGFSALFAGRCERNDRCPDLPEDLDGFEDADGCPDPDNDKDGVPDPRDACPDRGFSDSVQIGPDGCPVVEAPAPAALVPPRADSVSVRRWVVHFATGSDSLDPTASAVVDSALVGIRRTDSGAIDLVGHTDSRGEAEDNQDLSERRAKRVADLLVQRGVSPARLKPRGRGFSDPVSLNFQDPQRASNRRCEILLPAARP